MGGLETSPHLKPALQHQSEAIHHKSLDGMFLHVVNMLFAVACSMLIY